MALISCTAFIVWLERSLEMYKQVILIKIKIVRATIFSCIHAPLTSFLHYIPGFNILKQKCFSLFPSVWLFNEQFLFLDAAICFSSVRFHCWIREAIRSAFKKLHLFLYEFPKSCLSDRFYFLRLIKRISEETKKAAATARRIFPTSNAVIFSTNTAKIMTKLIAIIMRE